jgi:hypothetical protein
MHPVVVSQPRPAQRLARLADLPPERREDAAWQCISGGLRELCPEIAPLWLSISPLAPRGRRSGYMLEIVFHLPTRYSDIDSDDLGATVTLVESHMTVALLRLCHRLSMAHIRLEHGTAGELYCIAYIWIPAALPLRSGGSHATRGCGSRSALAH